MQPFYWEQAIIDLSKKDKKLAQIIQTHTDLKLTSSDNAFQTLIRSIVGQQISVRAADSVWNKITQGVGKICFKNFLKIPELQMKVFGLSRQKSKYIHNIAKHFQNKNIIDQSHWQNRSFEDITSELIQIKGVGVWTIQMFGIFYLLEPDILPLKDLGLIRSIQKIYNEEKKLESVEIEKITRNWQPWRSVATIFLWRSVDAKPTIY